MPATDIGVTDTSDVESLVHESRYSAGRGQLPTWWSEVGSDRVL